MINPGELVDNLVLLLRDIPDLVAEMGGDGQRIFAYHDRYPTHVSLAAAIHDMPLPGIMVAWQGTQPGRIGELEAWSHAITLYLRAGEAEEYPPAAYYRLFRLLTHGTPQSLGVPMLRATVHSSCLPMDLPRIERRTDSEGLDYFEVPLSFLEYGDE